MNVLNQSVEQSVEHVSAIQVAASLQLMILKLKGRYLSEDGKTVDYVGLKGDKLFQEFEGLSNQLVHADLAELSSIQRKAFFINIYNTLTIHGLCRTDPLPNSVIEVNNFWKRTAYCISGSVFSLDDIEHGILRANTRHPAAVSKPFSDSDPRLKFCMDVLDPRIHFVLNCGAKSCPAIAVYNEDNLESALTNATKNFLSETFLIQGDAIHLSKIFQWYANDFGSSEKEVVGWVRQYLTAGQQEGVDRLVTSRSGVKIIYEEYDWLINAK